MDTFKGNFRNKKRLEMIPITVVACNKDHGLLGIDVLKVDTTELINSIKAEGNNIGLLRVYRVSIGLKENSHLSYEASRELPIHILPMAVVKFKKNNKAKKTRKPPWFVAIISRHL